MRLADVDFDSWQVDHVATLTFVRRGDEVLLIHKRRGHGAGKINGPGGKVDAGESPRAAAHRETLEEVHVDTYDLTCRAELRFQDVDGLAIRGFAFVTGSFSGRPIATAEAEPFWCPVDAIPYDAMWVDDRLWLPRVLAGECVLGEFLMAGNELIDYRLEPIDGALLEARADQPVGSRGGRAS